MVRLLVITWCTVLGLSGPLLAQGPTAAILGRGDLAFALHLVRSGHPDLADGVCRALLLSDAREAMVVDHAARARLLADVDQQAVRRAVAAAAPAPEHGRRSTWLCALGRILLEAGCRLLSVPADLGGCLEWDGDPARAAELWSDAATLLQAAAELDPQDEVLLALARLYRLLGNPGEAALLYEQLFLRARFLEQATGRIARQVMETRPQLIEAYLEWGVVQRKLAAADEGDRKRFDPCLKVFENICQTMDSKQPAWWLSKREQILTFLDLGDERTAQTAFKSVERTTDPELMKQYGKQYGFDALRERLR